MIKLNAIVTIVIVASIPSIGFAAGPCPVPPIQQGQNYDEAHDIVISAGFQTANIPAHGYSAGDQKVTSDCFGDANLCNRYPEVESCSGDGHCRMVFHDAYGNELVVFTYGELGKDDNLIDGFEIACK